MVLLYGENEGLISHRANTLTMAVIGAKDDPFRVTWLSRDEHGRLEEESLAIAMIPGRRVIRVREAGDSLVLNVKRVLDAPGESLVVLEAGALLARGKLRSLCESAGQVMAIPCYPEEARGLQRLLDHALAIANLHLEPEVKSWAISQLSGDHMAVQNELEKLILYAGSASELTLSDVQQCLGDQAAVSLEDSVFSASCGNVQGADRSLDLALQAGNSAVTACRALLGHMMKIKLAGVAVKEGSTVDNAVRSLRPAVFYSRLSQFALAVRLWPAGEVESCLEAVRRAEIHCKQSQSPDELLVHRLFLGMAQQSASRLREATIKV